MKRIVVLIVLSALALLLALSAFAQDDKDVVRWPRTMYATAAVPAVGDTAYTLPELQPVSFTTLMPPPFFITITMAGGVALPGLSRWEFLSNGAGTKIRLLNLEKNSTRLDSVCVDNMGTATAIYIFGY